MSYLIVNGDSTRPGQFDAWHRSLGTAFEYLGQTIELKPTFAHRFDIFINGRWSETVTNTSTDGTARHVERRAMQIVDLLS